MEFNQVVMSRRSVFRFRQDKVSVDEILPLLSLAIMAPNHRLTQPWRFLWLGEKTKSVLAEFYGDAKASKAMATDMASYAQIKQKSMDKFLAIPAIVLVVCRLDPHPVVCEEDIAATHCAIQNLLLAVTDKGLGAQWSTHPMIRDEMVMRELGIDCHQERCLAMIYLGYPEAIPPMAARKSALECFTLLP